MLGDNVDLRIGIICGSDSPVCTVALLLLHLEQVVLGHGGLPAAPELLRHRCSFVFEIFTFGAPADVNHAMEDHTLEFR